MPLPARYLATKLAEPLSTTDGGVLRTIGDAIKYMMALPKYGEIKTAWQHACQGGKYFALNQRMAGRSFQEGHPRPQIASLSGTGDRSVQ